MRIAASQHPIVFQHGRTGASLVPYLACHKIIRHNRIPLHTSPWWKLALAEHGEFSLRADERHLQLTAGHYVLLPPKTMLTSEGGMNAGMVYWIALQPTPGEDGMAARLREEVTIFDGLLDQHAFEIRPVTRELLTAVQEYCRLLLDDCRIALLLQGAALTLVGGLYTSLQGRGTMFPSDRQLLEPALAMIDEHIGEYIRMQDLADACNMSLTPFYAASKRLLGTTPREYINRRRIEYACELLADPKATVVEVASRLGYSSSHYFARAFKKVMGQSPQQYRRMPEE